MAPELSINWKKLQASLKQDSKSKDLKRKAPTSERQLNSLAKRKRLEAKRAKGAFLSSPASLGKRARMGNGKSMPENSSESKPSASLVLWAEDHDISAQDLAQAYGVDTKDATMQSSGADRINEGLIEDVDIGQYVAIDCEMVGVGGDEDRSVLARVSIVNFHGLQVYDSFVRPKEFVTDWRTHVSGVSSKNMATARSFETVQQDIAALLKDRILVGHAVKHDLDAMLLGHPKRDIRDTSKFRGFRKYSAGKTPSLKKLAKEVLGVEIQDGEHSSIEDARATMLLFRRHKQSFDAEHKKGYPQQSENGSSSKRNNRSKR